MRIQHISHVIGGACKTQECGGLSIVDEASRLVGTSRDGSFTIKRPGVCKRLIVLAVSAAGVASAQRVGDVTVRRVADAAPAAVNEVRFDLVVPVTNGLIVHLAADAIQGLIDGAGVASWNDLSGFNNHATQGNAARQPVYKTGVLNRLPVVRFDGSRELNIAQNASLNMTATLTLLTVVQRTDPGNTLREISSKRHAYYVATSGDDHLLRSYWYSKSPEIWHLSTTGLLPSHSWNVVGLTWTTAGPVFYRNGDMIGSGSATGSGRTSTDPLNIGHVTNQRHWMGDFAEYLLYNRALSDAERQAVELYLGEKWLDW